MQVHDIAARVLPVAARLDENCLPQNLLEQLVRQRLEREITVDIPAEDVERWREALAKDVRIQNAALHGMWQTRGEPELSFHLERVGKKSVAVDRLVRTHERPRAEPRARGAVAGDARDIALQSCTRERALAAPPRVV